MEQLIKRQTLILEITQQRDKSLLNREYYDMFCKDIVSYIRYITKIHLQPYDHRFIEKVAIGSYKSLNDETIYDITHDVLFSMEAIEKELYNVTTIPFFFDLPNIESLFNVVRDTIESALIGVNKVSIYFDFFIINEVTMIFKCEVYKCHRW